jgi:hypothetical protein
MRSKDFVMLVALAAVLAAGTACFRLFAGSGDSPKEAEIQACAGLSGQARTDCEKQHQKP